MTAPSKREIKARMLADLSGFLEGWIDDWSERLTDGLYEPQVPYNSEIYDRRREGALREIISELENRAERIGFSDWLDLRQRVAKTGGFAAID